MATLPPGHPWDSTCKELYLPFFFQISEQPQEQGLLHPTFPLEGMGDEVPRKRRQPDLGTRRQMGGGRVAYSTVDSFTQMASKQREQWPALDNCKVGSQPAQREVGRGLWGMRWSCPTAGKVPWLWQRKGVAPHNDWGASVPGPRCQGSDSRKAGWSHEGPTQQAAPTPSLHCWLLNRPVAARVTADEQPKPRPGLTLR